MAETDSFGTWVRSRRRELDLTQEDLARRVGCARITIRKIEAGQLRPSKQMAQLLADRLGLAAADREDFIRSARGSASISDAANGLARHNLPVQLTRLVGRASEVAQVQRLLQKSRLVTLTGSGGTGKTRLALQAAGEVLEEYRHGVWFVDLAPLSDAALVPNTVASILGVRDEQGRPLLSTLLDWLRHRHLLLVLDNCEHLIDACAGLADAALRADSETRILATSREPLGIAGETSYRVPSLDCPEPSQADGLAIDHLERYPAVQLFIERLSQALPTFSVTKATLPIIIEICYRLDGIPLAIELAAARAKTMRLEQIAERLDDRFRLLTDGSRTALPRHQTLRSLIDWSHNLLSEAERVLLRRLSIFAGGWTLEAAEQVCSGEGIEPADVLGLLTHLADKSLVALDERAAEPRYRMLETIREYARDQLLDPQERDRLGDRHLRFLIRLAENSQPLLESAQRSVWLPRLEMEHDNLLAALEWACGRDPESARWLAGSLERFWFYGDHLSEARTWYARVLEGSEQLPATRGLALSLLGSGCVAFNLELMEEAQASLESSARLWQQLGDTTHYAWTLEWLCYLLLQRGEAVRADAIYSEHELLFRASADGLTLVWVLSSWGAAKSAIQRDDPASKRMLDEALALAHNLEDPFCFEMSYSSLGDWAMLQGDFASARLYFLQALEWRRKLGTRWIIAAGLWQVASIMRLTGDFVQAEPMYAEALSMARDFGDQRSEAHLAQELGAVATHLGDVERAESLLMGSLAAHRKLADALGIARCLLGLAELAHHQGHVDKAARLLGFIEGWLQSNRIQLVHFDRTNHERIVAAAHTELDEATFVALQEAGRTMSLDEAAAWSLERADL